MATGLVFVTVKQGSKQLKAREDCDLRPAESFNGLTGRGVEEILVDADIRVTMHPDARELSVLSASIRDLNSMVASRAMINPYVVVHITQPEPQPKSAAALEADAKAAAARALQGRKRDRVELELVVELTRTRELLCGLVLRVSRVRFRSSSSLTRRRG